MADIHVKKPGFAPPRAPVPSAPPPPPPPQPVVPARDEPPFRNLFNRDVFDGAERKPAPVDLSARSSFVPSSFASAPSGRVASTSTSVNAQAAFRNAASNAQKLNGELAMLLRDYGPNRSIESREGAVKAFKEKHKEEYDALEKAGAELVPHLQGAIDLLNNPQQAGAGKWVPHEPVGKQGQRPPGEQFIEAPEVEEARRVLDQMPQLLETEAGQKLLDEQIQKMEAGEPHFLEKLGHLKEYSRGNDILKATTTAAVKTFGARVQAHMTSGRPEEARKVIEGLKRWSPLMGVDSAQLGEISKSMQTVLDQRQDPQKMLDAQKTLRAQLDALEGGTPGAPNGTRPAQLLRAAGLAVGIAGLMDGWSKGLHNQDQVGDGVKLVGETLGVAAEGLSLALETTQLGQRFSAAVSRAGPVGAAFAAGGYALKALESLVEKDPAATAVYTMSAAGIGVFAARALGASIPLVGQVIAAALWVGGLIGEAVLDARETQRRQDDAKTFLQGAGLSEAAAGHLSKLGGKGPILPELARKAGVDPEAFLNHLLSNESQLPAFVEVASGVQPAGASFLEASKDDQRFLQEDVPMKSLSDEKNAYATAKVGWSGKGPALPVTSLTSAVNWMKRRNLLVPAPAPSSP